MAKRFIDTELFSDEWFMDLPKDAKLLYIYLFTNCDHAGIIELNKKLCSFQTGIKDLEKSLEHLGNRIYFLENNTFLLTKYFKRQYPNYPDKKFKAAESAVEILEKFGLWDENKESVKVFDNSYGTLRQDLTKSYGKGKGKGNGNGKENNIPTFKEFLEYAKTLEIYHETMDFQLRAKYDIYKENGWKDGNGKKISNWKTKLRNVMPYFKRDFTAGSMKSKFTYEELLQDTAKFSPDQRKLHFEKFELFEESGKKYYRRKT